MMQYYHIVILLFCIAMNISALYVFLKREFQKEVGCSMLVIGAALMAIATLFCRASSVLQLSLDTLAALCPTIYVVMYLEEKKV